MIAAIVSDAVLLNLIVLVIVLFSCFLILNVSAFVGFIIYPEPS